MKITLKILPLVGVLALSACASHNQTVTRADTAGLSFDQAADADLHAQTAALNATADRLVMASTLKGAALGAAFGCGLTAITGAGAEKCLSGAAVGAVGGGVVGHIKGKKDVARRVRLADPNKMVRNLRAANDQMADVAISLPAHLAAQDVELHRLNEARAKGQISKAEHASAVDVIRKDRARLAEALTLTASQASKASENLKTAASRGQSNLDWHILATSDIAKNATSARSTISLL